MRPLRLILCVGFAAGLIQACAPIQPEFHFGQGGSILPQVEALKEKDQCSRPSPEPVSGAWTPTHDQIEGLEAGLPQYFRNEAKKWRMRGIANDADSDRLLSQYFRQYAGLIVSGKKIIYVNAIAGWGITDDLKTGYRFTKAELICEGGRITFGVEFNPQTGAFDNLAFNVEI